MQSPRSESPGSASAERPEPPLAADEGKRWDTATGAWVQTQGPKPRAAPGGVREGAVVDAAAEAFGEDFARGRSKVKFRGTVVERGTTDGHDSGRPALSEEEVGGPVWRVRYDEGFRGRRDLDETG